MDQGYEKYGEKDAFDELASSKVKGEGKETAFNLILFSFDSIQKDRSFVSFFFGREER